MVPELRQSTSHRLSSGRPYPLGSTVFPDGVNFAVYSRTADRIWLLLFDSAEGEPSDCIPMEAGHRHVHHVFVHDLRPGQLYGLKAEGEYVPAHGLRFNPYRLLLDPYAKSVTGKLRNTDRLLYGYDRTGSRSDQTMDLRDNTSIVPKCVVVADSFNWGDDAPPAIPLDDLIVYEVHLKGYTAHPSSGASRPGSYLGFIEKIPHLKELGVNAVEFLPVMEHYNEDFLAEKGRANYWGYNTVSFFAPESSYASEPGKQVEEFKTLVRELHRAGIEVILDVVYNHSGEGNELGPTFCFKGLDNPTYYALHGPAAEPKRYYHNWTGCGNSLNLNEPAVLRLVMDSLRYWVDVMHVDGFRFDLASVMGRGSDGHFRKDSPFFQAVAQDPILSHVKLIAEPWDIGTYQAGNFPVEWSEWNGKFRDTVRRFVTGHPGQLPDLGWRLTGSADLYGDGRAPCNSVNFVTCHDGFTLNDLVSYNRKHNEANGEENRDGCNDNFSWNCGVEGETDDAEILALRRRLAKNFLCTLFFSSGTPMLLGGDEFLRTQRGNNNAYCQDNELSWFDWRLVDKNRDLFEFTRKLIAFTRNNKLLQRRKFFQGCRMCGETTVCDIVWYDTELQTPCWTDPNSRAICFQLYRVEGEEAHPSLYFILNADDATHTFMLPPLPDGGTWRRIIDTSLPPGDDFLPEGTPHGAESYSAVPRSTVVLAA